MSRSWSDQHIEEFVRGVLGCGCPDRVFETIQVAQIDTLELGFSISRLDIGNTLLIYIARPASQEELRNAMAKVVSEGRRDRDINGFNRFRLVVASDLEEPEADSAAKKFAAEVGADEKMHLHFIRADLVDGL
jgi:hypothetical protein